eukprot:TRINITY_DN1117_c0_g2_i1.p1 TRINITY_DN1117_c0_g2~~TRINITY_DN1117_c0_g2_i1.p1  ORF type:complete len:261 (-),score=20.52 TRINITY_DN1117_c0_g2_i1:837-1619(-)
MPCGWAGAVVRPDRCPAPPDSMVATLFVRRVAARWAGNNHRWAWNNPRAVVRSVDALDMEQPSDVPSTDTTSPPPIRRPLHRYDVRSVDPRVGHAEVSGRERVREIVCADAMMGIHRRRYLCGNNETGFASGCGNNETGSASGCFSARPTLNSMRDSTLVPDVRPSSLGGWEAAGVEVHGLMRPSVIAWLVRESYVRCRVRRISVASVTPPEDMRADTQAFTRRESHGAVGHREREGEDSMDSRIEGGRDRTQEAAATVA